MIEQRTKVVMTSDAKTMTSPASGKTVTFSEPLKAGETYDLHPASAKFLVEAGSAIRLDEKT